MGRYRKVGGSQNLTAYFTSGPIDNSWREHNYPTQKLDNYREMTDVVTPQWERKRNSGTLVVNPMSSYSVSERATTCTAEYKSANWSEGIGSCVLTFFGTPPVTDALTSDLARASAINEAYARINPANALMAVTAMELDKTRSMFRELGGQATQLTKSLYALASRRKTTRREQRETLDKIAGAWLTARYGLMPVAYEISGVIKTLKDPTIARETARGKYEISDSVSGVVTSTWRGTRSYPWSISRKTEYRAGCIYDNLQTVEENLATKLGLSFSDALTVPYELLRLSFVLDWAFDVGTWLRAVTPKTGVNQLASWVTRKSENVLVAGPLTVNCTESGWTGTGGGGSWVREQSWTVREIAPSPSIPGYGSGMNLTKSVDAAMLAISNSKSVLNRLAHSYRR